MASMLATGQCVYRLPDYIVLIIIITVRLISHCEGSTKRDVHDTASRYLGTLTRVADIPGRRALHSATDRLEVPYFKLSTIGGRAFPVAAPQIWNSLPDTVVSASTLRSFQHQLKTFLFQRSFIYQHCNSGLAVTVTATRTFLMRRLQ